MNIKKRKFDKISKRETDLKIQKIEYLLCECCQEKVYNYQECGNMIFCSNDCKEVLILSKKQTYLDENGNDRGFKSPMKRIESDNDLMMLDNSLISNL